ncbi:MAG: efflux RND transporter permease subunit [Planctomycetaceae bacterium]|nr:efflux RND transporter permease subunit [Planctomycetaceae bacterium]
MNISHFFIDRPVFAAVISLLITLGGAVTYNMLPVEQFPNFVPPVIVITASYPGANAETIVDTVVTPIEKVVNGVDNMIYINSVSTSDGYAKISVVFKPGTDPDMATVLVQNRVNRATAILPQEVTRQGITIQKQSTNMVVLLNFYNPDDLENYKKGKYLTDEEAAARNLYLANNVNINIFDQLARVSGVGSVSVFNQQDFSMRIWFNTEVLAARNISVDEIRSVLQKQNVQVAAGRIGYPPMPKNVKGNIALSAMGRLDSVKDFENIVLRTSDDGSILRLGDVAIVELGSVSYSANSTFCGIPTTSVGVYQNPGANSLQVADNVAAAIKEMREVQGLLGDNLTCSVGYDATAYVRESLNEVKKTLVEALVIVVLIVFLFLQNWRAAVIPTITIPVSLVGCFFIMWAIGFTVNSLTLFGLILVIGIVVDDAIIVVENAQRLIDEEDYTPYDAAKKAMDEVSGPIIATTFVLMSIFIPTSMVPGIVGTVYRQFALTIAGAVCISAICALTFAPAMAAIILRKNKPNEKKFFVFRWFNYFFDGYANFYLKTVRGIIAARIVVLLLWFGLLYGVFYAFNVLPTGFIPNEDQGVLFAEVKLPEGATLDRTTEVSNKMLSMLSDDPTGIANVIFVNGYSMLDGAPSTNSAFAVFQLKEWGERYPTMFELLKHGLGFKPAPHRPNGLEEILPSLYRKWQTNFNSIPEASIMVYPPPPVMGIGNSSAVEYELLDRANAGVYNLYDTAQEFCDEAMKTGQFSMVRSTFNPFAPRYFLDIDRDKVMHIGASMDNIFTALQANYGSMYINDFNLFNSVFKVYIQAHSNYRATPWDIWNMKFKSDTGEMVPVSAVSQIREEVGPQLIPRFQLYSASYIMAQPAPGVSSGDAIEKLKELSKQLPSGYGYAWTGMTYQETSVGNVTVIVFALCVVFAFFVLSAQYESWLTPVVILMAVPLGIGGALLAVSLRALDVNIYTQIGFILMVGLSAKNAILITEFAEEKRRGGLPVIQAAFEAGRQRLRPIMMTSFAFILGILPLVVASGAGAVSRHAIGTPVCGGMLTETLAGIYVTPVLFVLLTNMKLRLFK